MKSEGIEFKEEYSGHSNKTKTHYFLCIVQNKIIWLYWHFALLTLKAGVGIERYPSLASLQSIVLGWKYCSLARGRSAHIGKKDWYLALDTIPVPLHECTRSNTMHCCTPRRPLDRLHVWLLDLSFCWKTKKDSYAVVTLWTDPLVVVLRPIISLTVQFFPHTILGESSVVNVWVSSDSSSYPSAAPHISAT